MKAVVNDTATLAYCGPTVVAAITHRPISKVREAFIEARMGRCWRQELRLSGQRRPRIKSTTYGDVDRALTILGFQCGRWNRPTYPAIKKGWGTGMGPTLAQFLRARTPEQRKHALVIEVTGHWVTVQGNRFCDTFSKGQIVTIGKAPGRRKRVQSYMIVYGRKTTIARRQAKARAQAA